VVSSEVEFAAVSFDDGADDRQPQAGAVSHALAVGTPERLQQSGEFLVGEHGTAVGDLDYGFTLLGARGHQDPAVWIIVFGCILGQVAYQLAE
jgi:hypothetical protein